jgi:dihydroorotate dehydrogenase electron transfer subunit
VEILNIREETPTIKTLYFKFETNSAKPGQFFMIWDFDDEIPISISYIGKKGLFGISIKGIGKTTKHLNSLCKGDQIGVRGPYGNAFDILEKGKFLVAGGGIGIAPLMPLIEKLISRQKIQTTCVIGANTVKELPFLENLQIIQSKFFTLKICTDDGTLGFKGFVSNYIENLLEGESFDQLYTCGPELMMREIFELTETKKIPLQASLERTMKCGVGICGQCVIEPGLRVCKDGPVFDSDTLRRLDDFGKYRRDFAGRKCEI